MPRTNIPYRSTSFFLNKKRSSLSRRPRTGDNCLNESQQGSSCPVNNILVFPKNSETTINVLSDNSQSLAYGNLLKKIKGRKRKEKQRSKKKQNIDGDIKPVINNVKRLKTAKMKPRLNKHIIFLSDSDSENGELDNEENDKNNSICTDTTGDINCHKNDDDDDVIFVETPSAEIIEIDDSTEQTESSERVLDSSNQSEKINDINSPDVNDFLNNDHISLKSKFNFELHGSEFQGAEFLKPSTVPKDMSECGSVSSISDVSASVGANVFNVVDFPQEKVDLFDDNNLEKFRNSITPQRTNKKSKNVTNAEEFHSSSSPKHNDNLPTLSDIQIEDNSRRQRGRSIIKELVNERAYVILSAAQKKLKNKKRKSKDGLSDSLDKGSQNDNQELNKRKKKKKNKKRDTSPNELNYDRSKSPSRIDVVDDGNRNEPRQESEDEGTKYSIAIRTDLFESTGSEISTNLKKSKKNKRTDSEAPNGGGDEKKKKKLRKNDQDEGVSEENEQKKKKRIRQTSELSADLQVKEAYILQENSEEKRKNKAKRNHEVTTDILTENNKIELEHDVPQDSEDDEEKKKKKGKRTSGLSGAIIQGKNKSLIQCIYVDSQKNNEEKRKKKNRKTSTSSTATDVIADLVNMNVDSALQDRIEVLKPNEMEERELENNCKIDQDIETNEDKKKKKIRKGLEASMIVEHLDDENTTYTAKSGNDHEKIEIIQEESDEISSKKLAFEIVKTQENTGIFSNKTNTFDHELQGISDTIVKDDSNKPKNVMVNISDITSSGASQKSETYVKNQIQENIRINTKRISEAPENIAKKQKLEAEYIEIVDAGDSVTNKNISEEIEVSLAINTIVEETTEKNTDEQMVESTEVVSVESILDSSKKRKNESFISDNIGDSSVSIEPKRIKINSANSQSQIDTDKGLLENLKTVEKECNDEITNEKNENISLDVDDVVSVNESSGNIIEDGTSGEPKLIENSNLDISENADFNNSVLINNEGNIDMKITNVFSLDTSIFPRESSFANDIDVNNFNDKNNKSWNTDSSRFHSYNGSLFKDENRKTSDTSNEVLNIEAVSTPIISLDPKSHQNSVLESVVLSNSTLHNCNETIIVKTEIPNADDTAPFEKRTGIISNDVEVKKEIESQDIPKNNAEEKRSEQPILEEKNISNSTSVTSNKASEMLNLELPNDIEKIVKEKDNLDTVKRLCDFLEEATDPNDVLKKVSLLKQAFIDKSQDSVRIQEEVHITYDNDDVFSVSSECSSVVCIEDDVSVISIEDDITLANCSIADGEKEITALNESINSIVEKSNVSTEDVSSEKAQNQVIESEPSTSQPILKSTIISSETQKIKRGLDKYEVEDLQGYMSSDPKLWKIVSGDICPVRLPTKGKRCVTCREMGHLSYNCPNKFNLPKCSLCGIEGHLDFRCPNKLCTQCGRKAPTMRNFCDHCKHFKSLTCTLCKNKGHPRNKCPDLWRRYHLTINNGPLVQSDTLGLKPKENLWCSACAGSGHLEFQCDTSKTWRLFRNLLTFDPRIYYYDDVYKTNPRNTPDSVVLNSEPHAARMLLDDDNISSTITSNVDTENVRQDTHISSSDKTIEKNELMENTDQRLQGFSSQSNDADGVCEGNKALDVSDRRYQNFFMTADIESLKKFVKQELSALENNKFKLEDLIPRFIAFQEDSKLPEHQSRFGVQRKSKFYKQLNMLLYGKEKFKNGMVHHDKLKHFVSKTPHSLTNQQRRSLWNCYDSIFGTEPHEHANYMFFLKLLREKYGNQKWLH